MILAILVSLSAQAPLDCEQAGPMIAVNACYYREYGKADQALNRQWKRNVVIARREDRRLRNGGIGFRSLLADQRRWLKERDRTCRAVRAEAMGGTGASGLYHECLARETRTRTAELVEMMDDSRD